MANVQIWGKLNWSVDHKVKKEVESIWNALIKAKSIQNQDHQVKPENSENYKKDEKTSSLKRSLAAADPDSIPEEFLDALTCKRMCTKLFIMGKNGFFIGFLQISRLAFYLLLAKDFYVCLDFAARKYDLWFSKSNLT